MMLKIIRETTDPICSVRISAGGDPKIGHYLVFRGERQNVIECLKEVLAGLEESPELLIGKTWTKQ